MSTETAHLGMRLIGPLQAWGYSSQFSRRNTGLLPTKSAVLGICCAAMGVAKGSDQEEGKLEELRRLRFVVIAVPRAHRHGGREEVPFAVRRIVDYHTVQNTRTAEGKVKDTHLTWRQYLCDASFVAVLSGGKTLIEEVGSALQDPVWGLWLGRKSCIPAVPVFAGVHETEEGALRALLGPRPLAGFTHQREVDTFEEGTDTLPDQPLSFGGDSRPRAFTPRRVRLIEGTP